MKLVLLESPFSAATEEDLTRNIAYARMAMRHSLSLGEAPFASHLLYTQVLDDMQPDDRALGIAAGLAWGMKAEMTVVYQDFGLSSGMLYGIEAADKAGRKVFYRMIIGNGAWGDLHGWMP